MIYNDDISLSSGGAERVMTNLASHFAEAGFDCIVITHVRGEHEYPLNAKIRRIVMRPQGSRKGLRKIYDIVGGLRRAVKQYKPDVVVSFCMGMIHRALFATIGLPAKNVISYRNAAYSDLKPLKDYLLSRTLHLRASGVVFQTDDAMSHYPRPLQRRGTIIPNPVDIRFFSTHYDGPRHDVVSVGRLKDRKNHKMLVEAFACIADQVDDNLLLYGDGAERETLQEQIHRLGLDDRVLIMGTVPDVVEAIKSAKLFVLPSIHEGLPNALMEAMALSVPCIATDCYGGGPRHLLSDELIKQ